MKKKFIIGVLVALFIISTCACIGKNKGKDYNIQTVYSNLFNAQMYQLAEEGYSLDLDESINVYDSNQINLTAVISSPDGKEYSVPMFYYEEYDRRLTGDREVLYKVGDGQFRFRFTPRAAGEYEYYIKIVEGSEISRYPANGNMTFTAKPGTKDAFLTVSEDGRHLVFDNGTCFIGAGHNLCGWEWAGDDHLDGTFGDDRWFQQLAANGGNMTQFDLCEADQLEWTKLEGELEWSDCYNGLGYYNQKIGYKTDYKVNLCDNLGLYYRFTLYHWGDFDQGIESFSEWGWARNPYNTANGGVADTVTEFFTKEEAKAASRNYIRYCVARWGYSPSMMLWELWNEVDAEKMCWTEGMDYYTGGTSAVVSWHDEMAKYVKSLDIYSHPVSTSTGNSADDSGNDLWLLDSIDITTVHRYTMHNSWFGETNYDAVRAVKHIANARFTTTNKPTYLGEYGLSPSGEIQRENDKEGISFHNGLWSGIFSNCVGTTMHWTWGSYVDEYDLYGHYKAINLTFKGANIIGAQPFDNVNAVDPSIGQIWYMGLRCKNNDRAYLWVKDSMYDYPYTSTGYQAMQIAAGSIKISEMKAGEYFVEYIDTYSGEIYDVRNISTSTNVLEVPYPEFYKDIAIRVIHANNYYQSEDIAVTGANFTPSVGYTHQNENGITLYAPGVDIGGSGDSGRFAYLMVTGDFIYTARLDKFNYSWHGAKAGLMARCDLLSGSKMAFIGCYDNANYIAMQRKSTAVNAVGTNYGCAELGAYLRLQRVGNTISTYISFDGKEFIKVSEMTYKTLPDQMMVGVMASNRNAYGYNKAIFSDVTLQQE